MPVAKIIRVEIKAKDNKKVPVSRAVEVFKKIQDIVYNVGDHLRGNKPRAGGDFPEVVKKECGLVFKELKSGSVIAELQISDEQLSLPELKTYGERALENTNEIIETINVDDQPQAKLYQIIDDPTRLHKILGDLEPIWPEPSSDYSISYGFDHKKKNFIPERKPIIKELLHPPMKRKEEVIHGRIFDFRVDQIRRILIDTPKGPKTVRYPSELESYVWEHVGKLVEIHGEAILEGKKVKEYTLQSESDLNEKEALEIEILKMKDKVISFKEPIPIETEFEKDHYIFSNDKLNLLVVAPKIKDGLEELNEELKTLWRDYALAKDSELSGDAIQFKKYLLSLVGEET